MSSKRNHRIRSRKTYRARLNAAKCYLMGTLPWSVRQSMRGK